MVDPRIPMSARIVPIVIPTAAQFEAWREWVFRTVSQIMINYRGGPISTGEAGDVHGGDRLQESRSILLRSKNTTRPASR